MTRHRGAPLQGTLFRSDSDLHRAAIDIAAHALGPAAEIVGDEDGVVRWGFFDGHVVRREDTGRHSHHIAPRLAVVAAEGEIVSIPGMVWIAPAILLGHAYAKGG